MKRIFSLFVLLTFMSVSSFSQLEGKIWQLQNHPVYFINKTLIFSQGVFNQTILNTQTGYKDIKKGTYILNGNSLTMRYPSGKTYVYSMALVSTTKLILNDGSDEIYAEKSSKDDKYINQNGGIITNPTYKPEPPAPSPCYACYGKGRCNVCAGTGHYSYTIAGVHPACTFCSGTGACPKCSGTGIFKLQY